MVEVECFPQVFNLVQYGLVAMSVFNLALCALSFSLWAPYWLAKGEGFLKL
jgi:hypothetical protein